MANSIVLKKSSVTSKIPLTTDLVYGELALNYADGKLYFKNASNVITSFGVEPSALTAGLGASATKVLEVTSSPAIVTYGPITGQAGATLLDDVSGRTDSINAVFTLKLNSVALSNTYIVDSKDLQVTVNGERLEPYTDDGDFMFMPAYDACKGFRVRQNRLIIYNAPEVGSKISIIVQKTSSTKQIRRYPFSATNIGLGD